MRLIELVFDEATYDWTFANSLITEKHHLEFEDVGFPGCEAYLVVFAHLKNLTVL